jgi:outer membrane lipoprotein-sorting protein
VNPWIVVGSLSALLVTPSVVVGALLDRVGQVVEATEQRLVSVSTYRCQLHTLSLLGTLREERVFDYAFQRPHVICMRVIEGKDRGSVLVYRDGKVRGHRGGWLSWITLTYEPSHSDVVTIRGGRVDQSDLLFITDVLQRAMSERALRLSGLEPLQGRAHYRLDLLHHVNPLEDGANKGRFWIDQERLVVSQYELYDKDGQLIYRQAHEKLQLNVPLPDKDFKL